MHTKAHQNFAEKRAWAYPGLPSLQVPPNISGTGKATDFKFGWYIHGVYSNKSPLNSFEKRQHGRLQGLSKVLKYPYYLRNG